MATLRERIGQFQFSTLISFATNDILNVENHKIIKRFNSTRNPFSIYPTVIIADPFLFVYNNEMYLFYEEQIGLTGRGIIKMTKTQDLKKWEKPTTVLEENFHLSFPNVFELDGQIYMIPETGNDNSIRLYKPNADLTQWTLHKILLVGKHFVDSSIICHNGLFYLFTTDYTNKTNILRLYNTDSLDNKWNEHPSSPIATGENIGRCAGSVFFHNNTIFRPCQLTQKKYGEGVEIYKITVLSNGNYCEERVKKIIPNKSKNYRLGGHHFNYCIYKKRTVVATDVFELKLNFFEIAKRIFDKIKF